MKTLVALLLLCIPCRAEVLGIWCAPEDDCVAAIVSEFDKATKSIKYSMYNFTSPQVADALIRAHGRGVKVTLLLDKRAQSTRYSQAARCKAAGIDVLMDSKHPIHHVKERIIDDKRVLFGSFNDSRQATRNREDLVLDDTPKLVKRFADEFAKHLKHAEAL